MNKDLELAIIKLFDRDWEEDLTEEEESRYDEIADNIISNYGWEAVFEAANSFLQMQCNEPKSVLNFAHHYWIYGWYEYKVENPYEFLAYFYYVLDFKTKEHDELDILFSLSTAILPRAGYKNADTFLHTDYMPESDEKMIQAANKYKNK